MLDTVVDEAVGIYIERVDKKAGTVTFSKDVMEMINGASVYVHCSMNNELTGLGAIFDGDKLYGYVKETDKFFAPYKADANGKLTETALSDVLDYMEENFNSKINILHYT